MKKLLFLLLAMTILIGGPVWAAKDELKIYIWSEYMDEEWMSKEFQKKFGYKVRIDHFESLEEMMAKLQGGGASQYDLICLGDYVFHELDSGTRSRGQHIQFRPVRHPEQSLFTAHQ
jgi:spermidine/putrescine transport system substrate-binding protein